MSSINDASKDANLNLATVSRGDEALSSEPDAKRAKTSPGTFEEIIVDDNDSIEDDDDANMDVEVVSPTRAKAAFSLYNTNQQQAMLPVRLEGMEVEKKNEEEEDDMVVETTYSNATNPRVIYPHTRPQCGVFLFSPTLPSSDSQNSSFCQKCFCFVCDELASECKTWSEHCNAHESDAKWVRQRKHNLDARTKVEQGKKANKTEVIVLEESPRNQSHQNRVFSRAVPVKVSKTERHAHVDDRVQAYYRNMSQRLDADHRNGGNKNMYGGRQNKDMRITEVLAINLKRAMDLSAATDLDAGENQERKMEGDIQQLGLHKSFYMEGVKIGWPFPIIMPPQRQMVLHLIKALKRSLHVVLESPTGTGKSAAILCAVLGWQRFHAQTNSSKTSDSKDTPKIIYCSRTHSQVTQMVASLKKTPYRPRMSILGSRERLCIHTKIRPRGQDSETPSGVNANNECRIRVKHTEKYRKAMYRSENEVYDDDMPPENLPGDLHNPEETNDDTALNEGEEVNAGENDDSGGKFTSAKYKTCPHYRQLTTNRTASLAQSMFIPPKEVNCCSQGGEKSKMGVHDIEDLVAFGTNPHVQRGIAIYRQPANSGSIGLTLKEESYGTIVNCVKKEGAAAVEGSIMENDRIVGVNGKNVASSSLTEVSTEIRNATSDPVLLDVSRGEDLTMDGDYSSHAACPYFLSRALSKQAEIIFAPYNYVLDPGIRKSLDIDLEGSIVVLDEAHNVESVLRESGSGTFAEVDLYDMFILLSLYSSMDRNRANLVDIPGSDSNEPEKVDISVAAHTILLFLERIIMFLRKSRKAFEENRTKVGATAAILEHEQFHTADDTKIEATYDGPTGYGLGGKPVGCRPFFEKEEMSDTDFDLLTQHSEAFESHVSGSERDTEGESTRTSTLVDNLMNLISKCARARKLSEHYYISSIVSPNGSFDHAKGGEEENSGGRTNTNRFRGRFKKDPKRIPLIRPRTEAQPKRPPNACLHPSCRGEVLGSTIRHGAFCDGTVPRWEASLVIELLTPGILMEEITSQCRTVVLASGTLAPIPSLCAELNLFPPSAIAGSTEAKSLSKPELENKYRLQNLPKPLEADHVVNLEKQLLAVSIGNFPDGSGLTAKYANYSKDQYFFDKLGDAIASVVESIPSGGVLVFLPSYSLLRKCQKAWNPDAMDEFSRGGFSRSYRDNSQNSIWQRLLKSKGHVIVEPSGNAEKFEEAKAEYMESVRINGGCVLLAVFRGKMSEGISFNDNNARCVICVGIPFPSAKDRAITAKKAYNDEQIRLGKRHDLLPGNEWYKQQAYRAIAQALGRCIRHAADYGTVVLMDSRYCDDGAPVDGICQAHRNLPKWMRNNVRNLSLRPKRPGIDDASKPIFGGWPGLTIEMKRFFAEARVESRDILKKQQLAFMKAQDRDRNELGHSFIATTGKWVTKSSPTLSSKANVKGIKKQIVDPPLQAGHSISSVTPTNEKNSARKMTPMSSHSAAAASGSLISMFERQASTQKGSMSDEKTAQNSLKAVSVASLDKSKGADGTVASIFHRQMSSQGKVPIEVMDMDISQTIDEPVEGASEATVGNSSSIILQDASHLKEKMANKIKETGGANEINHLSGGLSENSVFPANEFFCVVCDEREKRILLLPCRHLCLCLECSKLDKMIHCPLCRAEIGSSMEVFT